MGDQGFPSTHVTTVTSTSVNTTIRYDPAYVKTGPGLLKCIQVVLNILGFICIEASGVHSHASRGTWFTTVSMMGFWVTGILLLFYLFHVIEKFFKIPWLKVEFIYCLIMTIFYVIAASLAAGYPIEAYSAAAFFGYCAMVAYGYDCFVKYKAVQAGDIAQGERATTKETVTSTHGYY